MRIGKAGDGDVVIKLENVSTVYEGERLPAIVDVDLSVKRNELLYVVGPNASGKTTLLETINGLLTPFRGKVSIFGLDLLPNIRRIRSEIGYVPQDFMVEPGEPYLAIDIVLMGRYGKIGFLKKPAERDRVKALEAMKVLGIYELSDRPMGKLSGGQQQKVMIARALAKEPRILLLDEPFSNLDPESRDAIPKVISELHEEEEYTTLIVTHDTSNLLENCDRVVYFSEGRIVADDDPEKVLNRL